MENEQVKYMTYFEALGQDLFRVKGRIYGYILRSSGKAICIDPPPGDWVDHLNEIGVEKIQWLLATHHHRDTLARAGTLVQQGSELAAPEKESHLIAEVDSFWQSARTYRLFDCDSDFFSLREAVPVAHRVSDGQILEFGEWKVRVVELPGHTAGSVAYSIKHDGKSLLFMGDNISGVGTVHNLEDFHWDYMGFGQGASALQKRIPLLRDLSPDRLLPAHGEPIDNPLDAFDALDRNLVRHIKAVVPSRIKRPDNEIKKISDHVFFVGLTSYCLISDSGKGFLWDCGYIPMERLDALRDQFGLKSIDVVSFSHYHDDHVCRAVEPIHLWSGVEHPRKGQIWCHHLLHDILCRPFAWKLPDVWIEPIPIDRVYGDETIVWEGIPLEFFEFPGQTYYHVGMVAHVDGHRMAFTGDNIWKPTPGHPIHGPIIFRNRYFLEKGLDFSARQLIDRKVDLICPSHADAFPVTQKDLEAFSTWAKEAHETIKILAPQTPIGTDPFWCRFDPFQPSVAAGGAMKFKVVIESPFSKPVKIALQPTAHAHMSISPREAEVEIPARSFAVVEFEAKISSLAQVGIRIPVSVNVWIDGVAWGELGEMLVTIALPAPKSLYFIPPG